MLAGRKGFINSRAVLDDLSREVLYFAAAAGPIAGRWDWT